MGKYAKWIGGGLGWAFGGPIGGIMGFFFGSMVDGMNTETSPNESTQPGDFTASLIVLTAAIMKADGKIMKSELNYVKSFFIQNFGSPQSIKMLGILQEVLKKEIDVVAVTGQIRHYMDQPARIQLLHFLFGLALADGHVASSEEEMIKRVAQQLNISTLEYNSIKAMFIVDSEKFYKILEINKNATNEEIKKAYRKMAIKYHPDKVIHLGEQYQKDANKKFQQVNEAYNSLKKERGFN